jgi:hypothetical protein
MGAACAAARSRKKKRAAGPGRRGHVPLTKPAAAVRPKQENEKKKERRRSRMRKVAHPESCRPLAELAQEGSDVVWAADNETPTPNY